MSEQSDHGFGHQAASGVIWLTLQKWAIRISGFATIAILTRFLSPEDFGTVAAASTVLPFFALLADLGFATYIVQAEKVDQRILSTSFWFSVSASLALTATLVFVSPFLGVIFGSDQVAPVLQVLSLFVIFTGFSAVPSALLRRAMRFKALATQGTVSAVAAQVVAVGMTFGGFGVWALVGQALTQPLIQGVLAWFAAKWRPDWTFSGSEFKAMARFGSQVLGVEFVALTRAWAEAAIISSSLGLTALGFLNIAQRLVQVVQDLTGSALAPVSTVAFARIRGSQDRLRSAYLRALRLIYATLSAPLTLVAVGAPLIIPIVFGDGWSQSHQVAQLLALAGIAVVGATLDHGLHYGLGRPGQWFVYALITDAATVVVTAVSVQWGLVGVGLGFLIVAVVATIARWFLVARLLDCTTSVVAGPFAFLVPAVVASGLAGWGVLAISPELHSLIRLILAGLAILLLHGALVYLFERSVIVEIRNYARRVFGKPGAQSTPKPIEEGEL